MKKTLRMSGIIVLAAIIGFSTAACTTDPDDSTAEEYAITPSAGSNGSVTTNPSGKAKEGATVTITATPDIGYKLDSVSVKKTDGGTVTCQQTGTGYTFTMPASNVTVSASFSATGEPPVTEGNVNLTVNLTISDAQITGGGSNIGSLTLSKSNAAQQKAVLTLANSGDYGGITWNAQGTGITGTGAAFSLDAADPAFSAGKEYFVTVELVKGAVPYNKTVLLNIAE